MTDEFRLHRYAVGKNGRHKGRSRSGPVTSRQVLPIVWRTALDLAGHDRRLIKVISPTRVEIRDPRY